MDTSFAETLVKVIEWRRYFHQYPELSYQEIKTSSYVADQLRDMGWIVRIGVGGHGLIADLDGASPGKRIALRADMDALPIQDQKKVEYRSRISGVMHACGHDGHTSALMGAAALLVASRDDWSGSVRLIFQPAEEIPPGGAKAMIRDGALDGVDEIYGIHLWTPLPAGKIATTVGSMMAAADEFTIVIKGEGGHGGLPHQTVDSVTIGAHFVVNLQSVVSRNIDPVEPGVISVGSIHAGTAHNVIADECRLQGTIRTMTAEMRSYARKRIEEVLVATCNMFGAKYSIDFMLGYPPLVNHTKQVEHVIQIASDLYGAERVQICKPVMAAEDFAYYLEQLPGCFIFVGAGNESCSAPHHHPHFDIDESALEVSMRLLYKLATSR
jgi:amidohydrolase